MTQPINAAQMDSPNLYHKNMFPESSNTKITILDVICAKFTWNIQTSMWFCGYAVEPVKQQC